MIETFKNKKLLGCKIFNFIIMCKKGILQKNSLMDFF